MVPVLDSREVMSVFSLSRFITPTESFLRNANKVRIVALYIQYREGVPDEDRRRLYQHARLSLSEQDAVNGLVHLGVRISRVGRPLVFLGFLGNSQRFSQGPNDRDIKKKLKPKRDTEAEYELSRFKPLLKTVIEV
jgi:syntaxin-binding protein 1